MYKQPKKKEMSKGLVERGPIVEVHEGIINNLREQ